MENAYCSWVLLVLFVLTSVSTSEGKESVLSPRETQMLSDLRSCCAQPGVIHRCEEKFLKLTKNSQMETDVRYGKRMSDVATCLAKGRDVTSCCRARGVEQSCLPLCNGHVISDHYLNKCHHYTSIYSNCKVREYGVLPGAVSSFYLETVGTHQVVMRWFPPDILPNTVLYYRLNYKIQHSGDVFRTVEVKSLPYTLEHLQPNTRYDVFFEPVNQYGVGDHSLTYYFDTLIQGFEEEETVNNVRACCENMNVSADCLPLCSNDAVMSDVNRLWESCDRELYQILQCGARDTIRSAASIAKSGATAAAALNVRILLIGISIFDLMIAS